VRNKLVPDIDVVQRQPIGTIQMFSGLLADIPTGWQLCDGTSGTPNLIAKFVVGAPDATEAGGEGGEETHTLTVPEMPNHNHTSFATGGGAHRHTPATDADMRGRTLGDTDARLTPSTTGSFADVGLTTSFIGSTIGTTGGSAHENLPAFFELAYIQRLS